MTKPNRRLSQGLAILALVLPASGFAADSRPGMESNVIRSGSDYRQFALASGGPEACAAACAGDAKCRAWSYTKPAAAAPSAICRLMSDVPKAVADACCVSGVAAAAAGVTAAVKAQAVNDVLQMPIAGEPPEAFTSLQPK